MSLTIQTKRTFNCKLTTFNVLNIQVHVAVNWLRKRNVRRKEFSFHFMSSSIVFGFEQNIWFICVRSRKWSLEQFYNSSVDGEMTNGRDYVTLQWSLSVQPWLANCSKSSCKNRSKHFEKRIESQVAFQQMFEHLIFRALVTATVQTKYSGQLSTKRVHLNSGMYIEL